MTNAAVTEAVPGSSHLYDSIEFSTLSCSVPAEEDMFKWKVTGLTGGGGGGKKNKSANAAASANDSGGASQKLNNDQTAAAAAGDKEASSKNGKDR